MDNYMKYNLLKKKKLLKTYKSKKRCKFIGGVSALDIAHSEHRKFLKSLNFRIEKKIDDWITIINMANMITSKKNMIWMIF